MYKNPGGTTAPLPTSCMGDLLPGSRKVTTSVSAKAIKIMTWHIAFHEYNLLCSTVYWGLASLSSRYPVLLAVIFKT